MTVTDTVAIRSPGNKRTGTVHIDTSLQVERCKVQKKAQVVEEELRSFCFKSTSSFAKLEFKRAWLQRLSYLYSATQKVSRVDELIGYISDKLCSHPGHRRRLSTCLQGIESFLARVNEDISSTSQLVRLRIHIRNAILGAYVWWDSSVTHEYDGTGCVRAAEQPKQLGGGRLDVSIPRCKQGETGCTINEFFEKNKDYFVAIGQAIDRLGDQASKELVTAKGIIERAEKHSPHLCDSNICLKLGDCLIAIDGLNMDCFAANNDKEWQLLSDVLGKKLLNPVRTAKGVV